MWSLDSLGNPQCDNLWGFFLVPPPLPRSECQMATWRRERGVCGICILINTLVLFPVGNPWGLKLSTHAKYNKWIPIAPRRSVFIVLFISNKLPRFTKVPHSNGRKSLLYTWDLLYLNYTICPLLVLEALFCSLRHE